MNTSQQAHSTTEELIVSYLDGELMRKELEVELFERLATHADARKILREYLVVRGAIHASESDARFQLSASVDQRTRARLQSMLTSVPQLEAAPVIQPRSEDHVIVATVATDRRMKTWTKRLSPALLLLLLAIGSTWYLTHSADQQNQVVVAHNGMQKSATTNDVAANQANSAAAIPAPQAQNAPAQAQPAERIKIVKEYIVAPQATTQAPSHAGEVAQNSVAAPQTATKTEDDPKDVMASHRFAKLIRNTRSINVTQQDRL